MKAKRFLSTVLSICLAVLTLFSFVGCGKEGRLYSFKEAYERELLTKEDFMNIAYYRHGKVTVQEDGAEKEIDFQPTIEQSEMSDRLEKILKAAISQAYQETGSSREEDDVTIIQYFGVYNGSYAVEYQIEGIYKGSAVMPDAIVDNIVFGYSPNNMLGIIKFD